MSYKFDGSKVFFTSDTHFYHGNIIRFCNRPFKDVEMMNETIISNWNNTVGQDDIVFHLGDFCLGGSAEWTKILDRLNGNPCDGVWREQPCQLESIHLKLHGPMAQQLLISPLLEAQPKKIISWKIIKWKIILSMIKRRKITMSKTVGVM